MTVKLKTLKKKLEFLREFEIRNRIDFFFVTFFFLLFCFYAEIA